MFLSDFVSIITHTLDLSYCLISPFLSFPSLYCCYHNAYCFFRVGYTC